jgi:bifunctional DNA-binding transcriptional regulator/antitoxin component of YhaV-PrlF toxin-antitoxin module
MSEERDPKQRKPRRTEAPMLREARAEYRTGERMIDTEDHAITRLSSKNQITLPVAMVRGLGMKAGDEISLRVLGDTIYLSRRPQTAEEWLAKFSGSIHVPGWETKESIDAYVQGERDSWTREGDDF